MDSWGDERPVERSGAERDESRSPPDHVREVVKEDSSTSESAPTPLQPTLGRWRAPLQPAEASSFDPWPSHGFEAGRWAPGRVRAAGLRGSCIAVAVQLALHANEQGIAWPSVKRLSDQTGFSLRTVQYRLRDLEKAGVIKCIDDSKGGRHRRGAYPTRKYQFVDAIGRPPTRRPPRGATAAPLGTPRGANLAPRGANPASRGANLASRGATTAPKNQEDQLNTTEGQARARAGFDNEPRGGQTRGPARLHAALPDEDEQQYADYAALSRHAEELGISWQQYTPDDIPALKKLIQTAKAERDPSTRARSPETPPADGGGPPPE